MLAHGSVKRLTASLRSRLQTMDTIEAWKKGNVLTFRRTLAVCTFVIAASAASANAIIMRDDVDKSRYRDLGEKYRQVLVQLGLPASTDGAPMLYSGMGTLIAPKWVLTAAHAVAYMKGAKPTAPAGRFYIFVKGRGYRVAKMIMHPHYRVDGYVNDVALIKLEQPVREPAPACLYEKSDERDQVVALVGTGIAGDGLKGPGEPDGALLGATVRVDVAEQGELKWLFRKPGDPRTTPLEGISGPGDSGGPAFIMVSGRPCVVGISSSQRIETTRAATSNTDPRAGEGRYGVTEVYTRVSHYAPWIREILATTKS